MKEPEPRPTMMLGGFHEETEEELLRRVVLHEFGHALGCVHEQANPNIDIPWDRVKVYTYYWKNFRWDRETVDQNIFLRYQPSDVDATRHDPASIMQYPVSNEHTTRDFEIGWNTELSETDKEFISTMYPFSF